MLPIIPDIYVNGEYSSIRDARVYATDAGLLFGAGLFETVLCRNGAPRLLSRHLERLRASGRALGIPFLLSDAEVAEVIAELLRRNELTEMEARVKILATPGDTGIHYSHRDATAIISAEPYLRPPLEIPWKLALDGTMHASPIARHKSTSYLAHRSMLHSARVDGYDDAILLDRNGNVAETTFASLLLFTEGGLVLPESPDALPGITTEVMKEVCTNLGMQVEHRSVAAAELHGESQVCVCNALLGPFPVNRIGSSEIPVLPHPQIAALRDAWLAFS